MQLRKDVDSTNKTKLSELEARERATVLEGEIQQLSGSSKREKNYLQKELLHLKDESKLSLSRVTADVRKKKMLN